MDKKNVDTSAKKPSLFEIFKTQYTESGTISVQAAFGWGGEVGRECFFLCMKPAQPGQVCLSSSGRKKTAAKSKGSQQRIKRA